MRLDASWEFILHLLTTASAYLIICAGARVMIREAGGVSLAQGALAGIGSYALAIGSTKLGWPASVAIAVGIAGASAAAVLLSWISLRLEGDYLVISTLAFQLVLAAAATNFSEVTNGPMGITGVGRPRFLGFSDSFSLFVLSAACAVAALAAVHVIRKAAFGRLLVAARDAPTLVVATGNSVLRIRIEAGFFGGVCAGIGGAILASLNRFVDPASMAIGESLLVLAVAVISGSRPVLGVVGGVALLVTGPELLRFVGFSAPAVGYARAICYGCVLVLATRSGRSILGGGSVALRRAS
jgi:branched-chain amino acid transport system permease protein